MDTSVLENIAEDRISHELQRHELLVAKPKSDRSGTDLIVLAEMADGVKFCRVQAKGRSFSNSRTTNIRIPVDYVTNGFICFLCLKELNSLYLFLPNEIRQWSKYKNCEYILRLSESTAEKKLEFNKFDDTKVGLIKTLIFEAEVHGVFKELIYGVANIQETDSDAVSIQGSVLAR